MKKTSSKAEAPAGGAGPAGLTDAAAFDFLHPGKKVFKAFPGWISPAGKLKTPSCP
jgi:hypothetical protein